MFRTDSQTGHVWSHAGLRSFVGIQFGTLQRDSHDHAPRSTRPRWRLRQTTGPRRRSLQGRHRRLRLGFGTLPSVASVWTPLGPDTMPSVAWPPPARPRPIGCRGRRRVGALRSEASVGNIGFKSATADFHHHGKVLAGPRGYEGCRGGSGIHGGTNARHRPRRDQPFSPACIPVGSAPGPAGHGCRGGSSPAPVAGGGAIPLHLLGDWPRKRVDHSGPIGCRTTHRGSRSRATATPHTGRLRHVLRIQAFFEPPLLDGVIS